MDNSITFNEWKEVQPEWVLDMLADQTFESFQMGWSEGFSAGRSAESNCDDAYAEGYDQGYQDAAEIYSASEDWE